MGKRKKTSTADSKPKKSAHGSSSKNGQSVLEPCSERKANLKKQKIQKEKSEESDEDEKIVLKSEIKELKKSMQELSDAMKKLHENILLIAKSDLSEILLREKETQKKKEEEKDTCCFDCNGEFENNAKTICVKGFQNLRPSDEISSDLRTIFGSCGEITRLFVPFECKSRCPLGCAFINLRNDKDIEKALELNGTYMGGRELEVMMAIHTDEYSGFTDFRGCRRCELFLSMHGKDLWSR